MVILEYQDANPNAKDPRLVAGMKAERQMAHYLGRTFAESKDVMLLHGLRLVDDTREEQNGNPVVAQIDHLVLHRHGAFIVESKSCTGSVRISASGSGRDEWGLKSRGQRQYRGMRSPLAQAYRQGDVLRTMLDSHKKEVLGKRLGFMQRAFEKMPIQLVASISDNGVIDYKGKWKPQQKPFRDSVEKADNVCAFLQEEMAKHVANDKAVAYDAKSSYGFWVSKPEEVIRTARLLYSLHRPLTGAIEQPPQPAPPSRPAREQAPRQRQSEQAQHQLAATCKACGESDALDAMPGKYGYYWKCRSCKANTTMPRVCSACSCEDKELVRIQKRGPEYRRTCGACSITEVLWRSV